MTEERKINTPSLRNHRRQFVWRVLVPVIAVAIIVIAVAVFIAILASGGNTIVTHISEVSTIWLVIPLMALALILLALIVVMIIGVATLLRVTPRYTLKAQEILEKVNQGARRVADGSVKPIVWVNEGWAAVKRIFKSSRRAI